VYLNFSEYSVLKKNLQSISTSVSTQSTQSARSFTEKLLNSPLTTHHSRLTIDD